MMKIYLLHLPMIMLKSMHLQVLIVRVICLVQLIKLNEIFYVYLIWWKHLFFKRNSRQRKGIIAEEIKMYQEQPGYKIMFNTLRAMYHHHPIKVDIAGSVESIYSITKDDLYLCYETFYHPSNMVLFVVGDVILNVFVMLLKNMKIVVIKQINLLFKEEQ